MPVRAVERKLTAILAADVAGYSRLVGADEVGTLQRLTACRVIMDELIAAHRGRIFNTAGDSVVAEFASAVDAVECAVAVQEALAGENVNQPAATQMQFRIGVHIGDVIVQGDNLLGDGVNIAARLEALAEPGGICVSGAVHDQIGTKVPVSFVEMADPQMKNIAQPVRTYRVEGKATVTERATIAPPLALPDKPSIAVLPFQNMSGDPEQEYFANRMVEEIITALSRIRWLFVIARNSTFTYKGQPIDVKRVGRELGVRYLLEGSVRKGGGRVRITAQLIEAETGAHLWADRFDGSLEDVFDLQDKVATSVAAVIEPALLTAETARSVNRPTSDPTAYDLYLRGSALVWSDRQLREALRLLEQAIVCDPGYGPALAWAATCCFRMLLTEQSEDREADRSKGVEFARRALEVAGNDPSIMVNAAHFLAFVGEDIGTMLALIDRALALNPSFARGWHTSGAMRVWAGQHDVGIKHFETALRLSPRERVGPSYSAIGYAHFLAHRFDEAVPKLLLVIQEFPDSPTAYRALAACYAHMGRLDEAQEIVARLRTITSVVLPNIDFLRRPEDRELWLSGLRLAAGETT
jgi:TolB-like protein/class 3 adenylate cyclase